MNEWAMLHREAEKRRKTWYWRTKGSMATSSPLRSILTLSLLCTLSLVFFLIFSNPSHPPLSTSLIAQKTLQFPSDSIKVYITDLPRSLNYGLLEKYWSSRSDSRLSSDADHEIRSNHFPKGLEFPPYPENPLIKQYSAEYWILGDLMTPQEQRTWSFAKRVLSADEADVIYVPFFATLSAEMELGTGKGTFRKKVENDDYERQRQVVDLVTKTEAWKRSGGRDHVFVLTGKFGFRLKYLLWVSWYLFCDVHSVYFGEWCVISILVFEFFYISNFLPVL